MSSTAAHPSARRWDETPSARLLKHIVRCFLRLSDNPRAREALPDLPPFQAHLQYYGYPELQAAQAKRALAQMKRVQGSTQQAKGKAASRAVERETPCMEVECRRRPRRRSQIVMP